MDATVAAFGPIDPLSDATLRVKVSSGTQVQDGATVTASVYGPSGRPIATDVPMTLVGAGTGTYALNWLAAWTGVSGKPVEGMYLLVVSGLNSGIRRTRRFRVAVQFTEPAAP